MTVAQWSRTESARRDRVKSHGVHFTPPELARFLARRSLVHLAASDQFVCLDPACGDGELLAAIAEEMNAASHQHLTLVGIDLDSASVAATRDRLARLPSRQVQVFQADFVAERSARAPKQTSFLELAPKRLPIPDIVDLVISNPPYVRTQVLGSEKARQLAVDYDLSGRVDLYHAFVRGMTDHLVDGGILGLLCSNRFLTTQGGGALRALLRHDYELCEVIDLGDTRLFSAAVLPAIIIARKRTGVKTQTCAFTRSYERRGSVNSVNAPDYPSILTAIDAGAAGPITSNGLAYEIERGSLKSSDVGHEPWTLTSDDLERWLATVAHHTASTFADLGPIRVGIKTTADPVFIRQDWQSLPAELRPEDELLHPLLTHVAANRWRSETSSDSRQVLYPHTSVNGRRLPIDLERFPRARAYFESHRERLTGRKYVLQSGRRWYEIWVPQNPEEWSKPKIVFPDISETPRFFLDTTGAIVNGDCYWITVDDTDDVAYLMLAVANSSFAIRFYDIVCANRLYAGRRRFITQYVSRFPIPHCAAPERRHIRTTIESLRALPADAIERDHLETELDELIWSLFGLPKESSG